MYSVTHIFLLRKVQRPKCTPMSCDEKVRFCTMELPTGGLNMEPMTSSSSSLDTRTGIRNDIDF